MSLNAPAMPSEPRNPPEIEFDRLHSLFQGVDKFDAALPEQSRKAIEPVLKISIDPNGQRQRIANQLLLANRYKRPVSEITQNYPAFRDDYAKKMFGKETVSDGDFYGSAAGLLNNEKDERVMLGDIQTDIYNSAIEGKPVADYWTKKQPEISKIKGYNGAHLDFYHQHVQDVFSYVQREGERLKEPIATVKDYLAIAQGASPSGQLGLTPNVSREIAPAAFDLAQARKAAMNALASLPADQQDFALAMAARGMQPKATDEKGARRLERGTAEFVNESIGFFRENFTIAGSEQEQRAIEQDYAAGLPMRKAERKLNDFVTGKVDPLTSTSWAGRAALNTVEGLPKLAAMFTGPGIALNLAATQNQLQGQFEDRGIETEKAKNLAGAAAVPITALQFVTTKMVTGKVPGMDKWISSLGSRITRTMALGAAETGVIGASTLVQMEIPNAFQQITASLDDAVPDVDWKREFAGLKDAAPDIFGQMLPLILVGTAVGSFKNEIYGKNMVENRTVLEAMGHKPETIEAVFDAPTLKEKEAILQENHANREIGTPTQKDAVIKLQTESIVKPTENPDFIRYQEIQSWMRDHIAQAAKENTSIDTPEYQSMWAESEGIKNRNGGMPPGQTAAAPTVSKSDDGTFTVTKPTGEIVAQANTPEMAAKAVRDSVEQETTSIKNAKVNEMRAKEGLPPLNEHEVLTDKAAFEEAKRTLDNDPKAGQRLVERIEKGHVPNGQEMTLLQVEAARLAGEIDAANTRLNKASGETEITTAQQDLNRLLDDYQRLTDASKSSGTDVAQALQKRKMEIARDFSLAEMTRKATEALGKKPSKEQFQEIQALQKKHAELQRAYDNYKSRMSELLMSDEPASVRVPRGNPPGKFKAYFSERADAAKARISARLEKIVAAGVVEGEGVSSLLSADNLADLAVVGADYIIKFGSDFGDFSKRMMADFGDKFKDKLTPHLAKIYDSAKEMVTTQRRLIAAEAAADRQIALLEEQIKNEAPFSPSKTEVPTNAKIEAKRARVAELKYIRDNIRDMLQPKEPITKESTANKAFKTRTEKRIAELEKKIAENDFTKKERTPLHLDEEANLLQAKKERVEQEYYDRLAKWEYDQKGAVAKFGENVLNVYDAARAIKTTGEVSFILRQGLMATVSHPVMVAKQLPAAFKAFIGTPEKAHAINLAILNHPDMPLAQKAKLHILKPGQGLTAREEMFAAKMVGKIPVVHRFEQMATVFLNATRFELWQTMRAGSSQSKPVLEQISAYVNESTGRGSLGRFEGAAVPLARLLFSPRFLMSRIQYATGHSLWGGDMESRRIIAKEYARALIGLTAYYAAQSLYFSATSDSEETDPHIGTDATSSDFGKIVIGNTRLDPMAGLAQVIVFMSRSILGKTTTIGGKTREAPFGGDEWAKIAMRFARSKAHPVVGSALNIAIGKDLGGNEVDIFNETAAYLYPITYSDIYQAFEEQNIPTASAMTMLAFLGEGLQSYTKQDNDTASFFEKLTGKKTEEQKKQP